MTLENKGGSVISTAVNHPCVYWLDSEPGGQWPRL